MAAAMGIPIPLMMKDSRIENLGAQRMPVDTCGRIRLDTCRKALEANHFHVFIADDPAHAGKIIVNQILPGIDFTTVSWGDSLTKFGPM